MGTQELCRISGTKLLVEKTPRTEVVIHTFCKDGVVPSFLKMRFDMKKYVVECALEETETDFIFFIEHQGLELEEVDTEQVMYNLQDDVAALLEESIVGKYAVYFLIGLNLPSVINNQKKVDRKARAAYRIVRVVCEGDNQKEATAEGWEALSKTLCDGSIDCEFVNAVNLLFIQSPKEKFDLFQTMPGIAKG